MLSISEHGQVRKRTVEGPLTDTPWEMGQEARPIRKRGGTGYSRSPSLGFWWLSSGPFTPGELDQQEWSGQGGRVWPAEAREREAGLTS